jgi:pyrroloquinoline quinone (PQQ) biosynthesis protein C
MSLPNREYFELHKEAEQRHSDCSEEGIKIYASNHENRFFLEKGIVQGAQLIEGFLDGFERDIFGQNTKVTDY